MPNGHSSSTHRTLQFLILNPVTPVNCILNAATFQNRGTSKISQRDCTDKGTMPMDPRKNEKTPSRVISSRNSCLSRVEGITARLPHIHKKPPDMVGSSQMQYLLLGKLFPGRIPVGRHWCNFVCKAWFLSIFNIKLLLSQSLKYSYLGIFYFS